MLKTSVRPLPPASPCWWNSRHPGVYIAAVLVAQINIDNEPELARQERIEVVPTLVLYQNGQALGSIVAPESKARIDDFILDVLGE